MTLRRRDATSPAAETVLSQTKDIGGRDEVGAVLVPAGHTAEAVPGGPVLHCDMVAVRAMLGGILRSHLDEGVPAPILLVGQLLEDDPELRFQ